MANFLYWDHIKLLFFVACLAVLVYRYLTVGRKHPFFSHNTKNSPQLKMRAEERKMSFTTDELDSTDPTSISSWLDEKQYK